jgi:uncharacterized protein (DUF427 family)
MEQFMAIPSHRLEPRPNQESVSDDPPLPRIEAVQARLRMLLAGATIADTQAALRVLETSHPPVYYFPPADVDLRRLQPSNRRSWYEFKGTATCGSIASGGRSAKNDAWNYPNPAAGIEPIAGFFAFYPGKMDECWVDHERVLPQQGDFYGGWITSRISGPFKGRPGTLAW